jgi:hypothetical protein
MNEKEIRQTVWRSGAPAEAIAELLNVVDRERKKARRARAHLGRLQAVSGVCRAAVKKIGALLAKDEHKAAAIEAQASLRQMVGIATQTNDRELKDLMVDAIWHAMSTFNDGTSKDELQTWVSNYLTEKP